MPIRKNWSKLYQGCIQKIIWYSQKLHHHCCPAIPQTAYFHRAVLQPHHFSSSQILCRMAGTRQATVSHNCIQPARSVQKAKHQPLSSYEKLPWMYHQARREKHVTKKGIRNEKPRREARWSKQRAHTEQSQRARAVRAGPSSRARPSPTRSRAVGTLGQPQSQTPLWGQAEGPWVGSGCRELEPGPAEV